MTEAKSRHQASFQVLLATLWLTLLVLTVKVWAGWATRSLCLLAESLHTLIDSVSVMLSLMAIASRHQKAGREVWGHDRWQAAGVLLLVAFLGFAGLMLLSMAVPQLLVGGSPLPVAINLPLIQLLGIAIAVHFCMIWFERYEARLLENSALRLNANHMLQDGWLSIGMLVGLVGIWRGFLWLDPLMAIVLVIMAIPSCWRMLNWQLPLLVRQIAIAPEAIAQIASQIEGVMQCRRIRSQGIVGRQVWVEMSLVLHPEFVSITRTIAERIEAAIRDRYGPAQVVIYVEGNSPATRLRFRGRPPAFRSHADTNQDSLHFKNLLDRRGEPDWN
jgi:cation diffusion facilitator family transporter